MNDSPPSRLTHITAPPFQPNSPPNLAQSLLHPPRNSSPFAATFELRRHSTASFRPDDSHRTISPFHLRLPTSFFWPTPPPTPTTNNIQFKPPPSSANQPTVQPPPSSPLLFHQLTQHHILHQSPPTHCRAAVATPPSSSSGDVPTTINTSRNSSITPDKH